VAIVVGETEKGLPLYRSVKGFDIDEEDRRKADRIDLLLSKELREVKERYSNMNEGKERNTVYWEIGQVLRRIFKGSELPMTEFQYFIINASNRMPDELKTKKRSANRDPILYCYRLGGLSKDLIKRLKWSEWSHLFDQPGINREQRFDAWLAENLVTKPNLFDREGARLLTKFVSAMLKNILTSDYSDDELYRCYNGALAITDSVLELESLKGNQNRTNIFGRKIQNQISYRADLFIRLIEGAISPIIYAEDILSSYLE